LLHQPVRAVLGSGEYDGAPHLFIFDDIDEKVTLVRLSNEHHTLVDRLDSYLVGSDLDSHRFGAERFGEALYRGWYRGAEEKVLTPLRKHPENPPEIADESHVEHPIRLVEDKELDGGKIGNSLTREIEEPSWCSDEDVNATSQCLHLSVLAHTSEHDNMAEIKTCAVGLEPATYLGGEFTRRGEDESAWCPTHP